MSLRMRSSRCRAAGEIGFIRQTPLHRASRSREAMAISYFLRYFPDDVHGITQLLQLKRSRCTQANKSSIILQSSKFILYEALSWS
jgi:hypothetical protein